MPDGSEGPYSAMASGAANVHERMGGIVRDAVDVRDRFYEPSLRQLPPALMPDAALIAELRRSTGWELPRIQGPEGSCGGQALSALIDYERLRAGVSPPRPSSPRMIQEMARISTGTRSLDAGVSLRDVIKSFYNYGVCSNEAWRYRAAPLPPEPRPPGPGASVEDGERYARECGAFEAACLEVRRLRQELTVARAQEAKALSLGAYYRLRPNMNTYHAALVEAGAVLVSAELHGGWSPEGGGTGVIGEGDAAAFGGECHAFVIVGYTAEGFLVLNSWGRNWGGWRHEAAGGEPIPGVALWRYEDWAISVIDGWVLRLGVGAAGAFEYSIGDQGMNFGLDREVRSTPVHAVLGSFLHLDDGDYVGHGAYPTTKRTLDETRDLLKSKALGISKDENGIPQAGGPELDGVLVTFAGSLHGLKEAVAEVARQKKMVAAIRNRMGTDLRRDWYPLTILWSVDYVEQARSVLDGVFRSAAERAGRPGRELDDEIERHARGVGRAFWRDMQRAAKESARLNGPFHDLVRATAALGAKAPGLGLRVVAESEGAFALRELAMALDTPAFAEEADLIFGMLESVDLIAPPMTEDEIGALVFYLRRGWGPGRADRRIHVHLPKAEDERRLAVPPYGRSYFELVRRGFCPANGPQEYVRDGRRRSREMPIVARRRKPTEFADKWDDWLAMPQVTLVPIEMAVPRHRGKASKPLGSAVRTDPRAQRGALTQLDLLYGSDVEGRLEAILRRPDPRDTAAVD